MNYRKIDISYAPWTEKQIEQLNEYQNDEKVHPYTCEFHSELPLLVSEEGFYCSRCCYAQNWCFDFFKKD